MMDMAVLGSEEFVLGFRLAGIKRVYTAEPEDYEVAMTKLLEDESIGILTVDSSDLNKLSIGVRNKALDSISPVVVPVGKDESDLREKVKRAIGVDLYKN